MYAYRNLTVGETLRFIGPRPAVIVAVDVTVQAGAQISVAEDITALAGAGSNPPDCPVLFPGGTALP